MSAPSCSCGKPARYVVRWRTSRMWAPAFWYECDEHIDEAVRVLSRDSQAKFHVHILGED